MEEEKTLLQQIRDKEQEFSKKIETVKQETDAQIAAAGSEREGTIVMQDDQEKPQLMNYTGRISKRLKTKSNR